MTSSGALDEENLRKLIERHIAAGTDAIVVNGTTGEAPTLTESEKLKIIKIAIEVAADRVPIIAGTGTNATAETIHHTELAMNLGVDACLIITPYYNKPTQEGLYQHFKHIAEAVPVPIILYNVPGRTVSDLLPETIERLAQISNIIGLKEATGDLQRARDILALCGNKIDLYSGDDASALAFMLQGGKGVISVTANVAPKEMHEMCAAALAKDIGLAGKLNSNLMPLHKALFVEANPIPVKWAVAELGWVAEGIRLPLTPLSEKYHETVKEAMKMSGVI
jgi:4-hydroxy-tetrahydrodipicolinate synthase